VSWFNVSMRVWIILFVSAWFSPLLHRLIPWRRNTWSNIKEIELKDIEYDIACIVSLMDLRKFLSVSLVTCDLEINQIVFLL
jgi:hypothetical protein